MWRKWKFGQKNRRQRACGQIKKEEMMIKEGGAVTLIADDPTVRCMERTGYPPWMVYGGKNEEEQETEHE